MTETIEFTSRLFGRYFEMHAFVMRQSLEVAEVVNNGMFAICKAALTGSDDSRCGMAEGSSVE